MNNSDYAVINISIIYRKTTIWEEIYAGEIGLSAAQIPVISAICRNNGISQSELCNCLNMDKGTIAKNILNLERNKFVTREKNPIDQRAYFIIPTKKALDVYPIIVEKGSDWFQILTRDMTDAERFQFECLLVRAAQNAVGK